MEKPLKVVKLCERLRERQTLKGQLLIEASIVVDLLSIEIDRGQQATHDYDQGV